MITSHPTNDVSSLTYASRKKQRTIQSFPTHGAPPSAGAISSRPRGGKTRQVCRLYVELYHLLSAGYSIL